MEVPNNYKVLFGKKNKMENTNGETEVTMYKQIGQKILPELFDLDANTVADHIKILLKHIASSTADFIKLEVDFRLKVMKISQKLYNIFFTCLNVVPIAVTTALGPNRHSTVWYQDSDYDDPNLASQISSEVPQLQEFTPPALTPQCSFGSDLLSMANSIHSSPDISESLSLTKLSHNAKPSLISCGTLLKMQREQFAMLQQKHMDELVIKKQGQLIEGFKLCIWTKEEYLEQVSALEPALKHQKQDNSFDDGN
ncbi:hypothetical protein C0993_005324 [Termitomyces sp. T159_Od127]|nr:hypothetical protein C0993_005324 [Termitomyces sp. T159_Od127]